MSYRAKIFDITKSRNFKHGILYTVFSFINSGMSFILLLILAKYLKPLDYGYLNLFTTFVTLLSIVISLSTTSYVSICFFHKDRKTLCQVILISVSITTIMFVAVLIFISLFNSFIVRILGIPFLFLIFGSLICYFQVFNTLNLDIWRLEEKPISYGYYSVSFAVCNFIFTLWFIIELNQGWKGRVYAWTILATLYFIISLVFLIRRNYLKFIKPSFLLVKETLIYALPLIPHTLSFWLKQGLDRYIINYFHQQTVVGYFSFAMNLAAIITIIGTSFNSTNSVFIFKKLSQGYENSKSTLLKQTKIMIIIFFIVSAIVMVFAIFLIKYFIPSYCNSLNYILPLCIGGYFQCLYLLWVNYLFYYKKTRQLMTITLSTALLQVGLSLWLTRFSPLYTAWISAGVFALTAFLVYSYYKYYVQRLIN